MRFLGLALLGVGTVVAIAATVLGLHGLDEPRINEEPARHVRAIAAVAFAAGALLAALGAGIRRRASLRANERRPRTQAVRNAR